MLSGFTIVRHAVSLDHTVATNRVRARATGAQMLLGHLRFYASDWIERLTGARVFEYRNYVEV
jgi:hypothetical protein